MNRRTRSCFCSAVVLLLVLGVASTAFGQTTIYWKKDYIADANGVPIATATPVPGDQTAPSTPTGLTTTSVSFSYAALSWSASTDTGGSNLAGYKLYRNGVPVGATTTPSITDHTVEPSKTYSYTVVAVDWAGNHSSPSSSHSVTAGSVSGAATLSATYYSSSQIDLSWTGSITGETGFLVERKIGLGGRYALVATPAADTQEFHNTGLDGATVYYYRIRAVYAATTEPYRTATSAYSNEAYACTCGSSIPGAGAYDDTDSGIVYSGSGWGTSSTVHYSNSIGNKATFSFDGSKITWEGYGHYDVGIAAVTIDGILVANIDAYTLTTTYQMPFTFPLATGPHTLTVATTDRKNSSSSDDYVVIYGFVVDATLDAPAAPGNLSATAVSSTQIALRWIDSSTNEAEFKIEWKTGTNDYQQITPTVGANNTQYLVAGLSSNTTYTYRVRASNATSGSSYSNEASATTSDSSPPSTPAALTATATSTTSVSLSWTASSDNILVHHYDVQRRSTSSYSLIAEPASASYTDNSTYSSSPPSANVAYLYRVRAVDTAGNTSNWSNLDLATTAIFDDDPLTQYSTTVQARHFTQLRTAIDHVRTTAGLGNAMYTNSSLSNAVIYALDLQQMRAKLGEARDLLGLPAAAYSESVTAEATTKPTIKKSHIEELRGYVK